MSRQFGILLVALTLAGLMIAAAIFYTLIINVPKMIPIQNLQRLATSIPVIIPHNVTYKNDLYKFELKLPADWVVNEVVRVPEPEPILHHDCANYTVISADGTIRIGIQFNCGVAGWTPEPCPPGSQIVGRLQPNLEQYLVRFYDPERSAYVYTKQGQVTWSKIGGYEVLTTCFAPPMLPIGDGRGEITLQYLGPPDRLDQVLQDVDQLVLSIRSLEE